MPGTPPRKRAPRKAAPAEEAGPTTRRAAPRKRATSPTKKPAPPEPAPAATTNPTGEPDPTIGQHPVAGPDLAGGQRPPAGSELGTAPTAPGPATADLAEHGPRAVPPRPDATGAPAEAAADPDGVPSGRVELAVLRARLLAHPGFAPELLALAAVEGIGPRAQTWARGLREAYPDAGPDGLARLATRRFVRWAGVGGATAAVAGLFAPVAELTAVLWTQSALVLHVAAAYGRDPLHPDRAVELLVLTQVHPDADSARAALDSARAADGPGDGPWPRAAEAAWRLAAPLAAQAGGWAALRLAARLLPGAAVLATAAGDAAATERLAARAVASYRPARVGR
ncbi:hypothetical protein AB0K25_00955 [Micromonospora sp. NPDC049257]|uniref:hypothetical protein n=1 Tax=Micromonospora sp. NPDC049257 TaxID=3155771 RepID=UPI003437EC12